MRFVPVAGPVAPLAGPLGSTRSTMATLVHEVAHRAPHADDGSAEHREEIERLVGLLAEVRFGL